MLPESEYTRFMLSMLEFYSDGNAREALYCSVRLLYNGSCVILDFPNRELPDL